ncbi:class I tRNA ligase family protein, partial [Candidatus Woesearchaeota archaeon]|nr:class I tRNA ligase family protein [Candidatus Woesearchaeota archaeon]
AWVANADDWNFSRQRYWGVPIPIWKGKSGKTFAIGSVEELKKYSTTSIPDDFDLHTVNEVKLKHPETGEELERINDIFDVWYDSGSAPYASLGYPFRNRELFENHYPLDRINESQDQIRGWFYSLMFCNVATFGKAPYKTISMPGWVLDDKGEKMSKSLGNFIPAKQTLEELGADAVRFYYCWDISPGSTQKFSLDTIRNDVRKFFSIWSNLINLVKGYGEHFSVKKATAETVEDEWLVSRLHTTIKEVHEHVESFALHLAGRSLQQFIVEDLSRTYVQLVRERLEADDGPAQLISHSLWQVARLAAAITPFQSEQTYQELRELAVGDVEESVHLEVLPAPDVSLIDERLEESMSLAGEVIAGVLSARDRAQIGVRWPLQEVVIDTEDDEVKEAVQRLSSLITRQTNVQEVKVGPFRVTYGAKPNYQSLGKTFGERTGDATAALQKNEEAVIKGVVAQGKASVGEFEFFPEHVHLEKVVPATYSVGEFKRGSAYVLKEAPEELVVEGFAREVMRRLQQLRKEAGLEKHDRIEAVVVFELADKLRAFKDDIARRVGADKLLITAKSDIALAHRTTAKVKGKQLLVMLKKVG